MSFQLANPTDKQLEQKDNITYRKENDSLLAHPCIPISKTLRERTSTCTSQGSMTLEAALATSFFFFAALCLVCLFEIMALQTTIKSALHGVGKEVAVEVYLNPVIPTSSMERELVALIGADRLERSFVVGGSSGLDCSNSKKYWNTTIMDLSVCYKIEIPILLFRIPVAAKEEKIRIKGWTGYEVKQTDAIENTMVYVTDYGIVYHMDRNCTHLDLSIRAVEQSEVSNLRNLSGGSYQACTSCVRRMDAKQKVYVTDYGERYHSTLDCSGLKRSIYVISLTDVHGLGGCSKCVK